MKGPVEKNSWIMAAAVIACGCVPEENGVIVDTSSPPDQVFVQIEIPDLAVAIESPSGALDVRGLHPAIRVGHSLEGMHARGRDVGRFVSRLRAGTEMRNLEDGTIVPIRIEDDRPYTVHDLSGEVVHDRLGPPRYLNGYSIVPQSPLSPGWYMVTVRLPSLPAGEVLATNAGSFANRRVGRRLLSRFHVGPTRLVVEHVLTCANGALWHMAEIGLSGEYCHFSFVTAGMSDGENAGNVGSVTYDGMTPNCFVRPAMAAGVSLYGWLCPQPEDGASVIVTPAPAAGTDWRGSPVDAVHFSYDSFARNDPDLAPRFPSGFVSQRHEMTGGFGLSP